MNNKALVLILYFIFFLSSVSVYGEEQIHSHSEYKQHSHFKENTQPSYTTQAIDLKALLPINKLIPKLLNNQVVFIGEQHPRFDHHLNQLSIIRGLYLKHTNLAIGMEYFQQPFQKYLDQYIAGKLTTHELIKKTEYYNRWRYDFRLYEPILKYARAHHIPIIALNAPTEIVQKVGRDGLGKLTTQEKAQIPTDIDFSDEEYAHRLKRIFQDHPQFFGSFETFHEAQLVWDETMADRAASFLKDHPDNYMVVLAGNGHFAYGSGIPNRLYRRLPNIKTSIILNDWERAIEPAVANYTLISQEKQLPNAGFLGLMLEETIEHGLKVEDFSKESPAKTAGVKIKDKILALNDQSVSKMSNIKEVMWDKKPGDEVIVKVSRSELIGEGQELVFKVILK
ncbi:ChaN family lipoprotein [Candidatus Nitrosacidococcus sp. I8]|uniref:ChaN family lipoprotein n=1 Tax=Candidatus Nitrosacidococcus sp. I8 TaxID=2942908 RepID=UPI00222658C6|nr:ChaN family lipoprotein [Candidatus Nitrosacidococcus sp. I8]CAH9018054.1 hypothetical protein NURINAE_00700 [Candidatus Nitrosacidococcus sp. I8]